MGARGAAAAARAPWSDQKGGRHATAVDCSGELCLRRRERCRSGASLVRDVRPGESDRARRRGAGVQVHQSALVHHSGGQAAGRQHPALEPRRRCSERVGPRRVVEQHAEARRRAEAHDRAVAQRCTRRLLVREQDQAQGRTTDPSLAVDSSSVSPPIAEWEDNMPVRSSIGAVVLATVIVTTIAAARAHDETKYPDWSGQWKRPAGVGNQWDTSKPPRRGQQAPLTPEYQGIYEANLKDQAAGGQGTDPTYTCIPDGMPRAMNVIFPMEIIIQPNITYIMIE